MEDTELIWVDKDFAEQWKALTTEKATREMREKVFNEYMKTTTEKVQQSFRSDLENLEEDAAIFQGLMLKVKQAFEKAKNEHLNASYDLWEKFESEIPSIRDKTNKLIETLRPLEAQLNTINGLLGKINTYNIDKFISSISVLASSYGKNKDMIEFLIKHFGAETKEDAA